MSVEPDPKQRSEWFLKMPKREFPRANYLTEEVNQRLYGLGQPKVSKQTLKDTLLACGQINLHKDPEVAPQPLEENQVLDLVNQFFSTYCADEDSAFVKVFILQYTRMELFQTVRYLWGKCGDAIPVDQLYQHVHAAAGKYQGEKITKHLIPDKHITTPIQIENLSTFFFQFEAMLKVKAVEDGELAELNLDSEVVSCVKDRALDQLSYLLSAPNANPNVQMDDLAKSHVLHAALDSHIPELVQVLLKAKADVDAKTAEGNTALICALEDPDITTIQHLLSAKADVNSKRDDGSPALHVALSSGNDTTVHMLVNAGADPKQTDSDGNDAVAFAKDMEAEEDLMSLLQNPPATTSSSTTAAAEETPAAAGADAESKEEEKKE